MALRESYNIMPSLKNSQISHTGQKSQICERFFD